VFAYNINLIFKPRNLIYNCTGVAVGCGWQAFVAYVKVGCYYVVGIPLGCLLGFKFDLGAKVYQLITLSFPFLTHTNPMPMYTILLFIEWYILHPYFIEFGFFPVHGRGAGSFF